MLAPRNPPWRQICQFANRLVMLVSTTEANNNPIVHIRRSATKDLPASIIIMGDTEDGKSSAEYLYRGYGCNVLRVGKRPLRFWKVVLVFFDGIHRGNA